ncbi:MAG: hypothetical protein EOP50_17920 [Sphingobacteriales bacterium]|nr:MAG: hypothetical protein EOP50_17920 [Sphingobacteriales bacterium]
MAKPAIRLNIPEPCSESWQEMSPVDGGRHCQSCSKTVLDFTALSDQELISFFTSNRGTPVCCRLHESQVNREISAPLVRPFLRVWQRAAALLLAAQSFSLYAAAQPSRKAHTVSVPATKKAGHRVVKGQLHAFEGLRPSKVDFIIRTADSQSLLVTADSTGAFSLQLPASYKKDTIHWERQDVAGGYIIAGAAALPKGQELLHVYWQAMEQREPVIVEGYREHRVFGGLPVVHYADLKLEKKSFFRRLTGIFQKKKSHD